MRYCPALSGSLSIERDKVHYCVCCKQNMPAMPWNPDEDLPIERIRLVRDALVKGLNDDLNKPVPEYETYGIPGTVTGHPCKGCRHTVEMPEDSQLPSTAQLTEYLHLQAFTYCNSKCIYCNLSHEEGNTPLSRGRDLDVAVYRAVAQLINADAIARTCEIWISSGEPSISKKSMETLSMLVDRGFPILLNTNAIRYAPEIEQALKLGKIKIQVSVDSGSRDDYLAIKGVDKFDDDAKNIDRYLFAAKDKLSVWIKYIVFSENNSKEKLDRFIDFCVQHKVRNISLSTNLLEGEDTVSIVDKALENKSLEAFGYLASRLELSGFCVHKTYAHLTRAEQARVKRIYALSVMDALQYTPDDTEACISNIIKGSEMAVLPKDEPALINYMTTFLKEAAGNSKGIALFSAGANALWISSILKDIGMNPVVVFDNNPPSESVFGFPIDKPGKIKDYDVDTVIIGSSAYHLQIYSQLQERADFAELNIIDPYLSLSARTMHV